MDIRHALTAFDYVPWFIPKSFLLLLFWEVFWCTSAPVVIQMIYFRKLEQFPFKAVFKRLQKTE